MLNRRRASMLGAGLLVSTAAGLCCCEGPQPLSRAINPADEQSYLAMQTGSDVGPGPSFLRAKATMLGITIEEARTRDAAISSTENPFNARRDQSAVSRGAVIYSHECMSCHGENVDGRGAALPMPIPSMDFHRTTMRMDITAHGGAVKKWFKTIQGGAVAEEKSADGSPITVAMPAFGDRLAREQIWLVITYLQSLDADLPSTPQSAAEAAR